MGQTAILLRKKYWNGLLGDDDGRTADRAHAAPHRRHKKMAFLKRPQVVRSLPQEMSASAWAPVISDKLSDSMRCNER